jgi:hypothetical protein
VILAQVPEVARDRFLDFDDQFADFVEFLRIRHQCHADTAVVLVAEPALEARTGLYVDLMTMAHEIGASGGNKGNAPFQGLGFRRHTDTHAKILDECSIGTGLAP